MPIAHRVPSCEVRSDVISVHRTGSIRGNGRAGCIQTAVGGTCCRRSEWGHPTVRRRTGAIIHTTWPIGCNNWMNTMPKKASRSVNGVDRYQAIARGLLVLYVVRQRLTYSRP